MFCFNTRHFIFAFFGFEVDLVFWLGLNRQITRDYKFSNFQLGIDSLIPKVTVGPLEQSHFGST